MSWARREQPVVIVDDSMSVWGKDIKNLVLIQRYNFFGSGYCSIDDSDQMKLSKLKEVESESDGALAITLDVLKDVHQMFFDRTHSADFSGSDVRELIPKIGEEIPQACVIDS